MRKKYPLADDLKILNKGNVPFSRLIFPFASIFLNFFKVKSDDKIEVIKGKLFEYNKEKYYFIEPKETKENMPCLIYFHGGGFAFKASQSHYDLARQYCINTGCCIFFVDYSLSPRHKFPKALYEGFNIYKYVLTHAKDMGIDPNKIAVGGDSAGGNLAASITNLIIDNNLNKPCFQLLIYPVLDATMKSDSMQEFIDTPLWDARKNQKMWKYYLNKNEDIKNPYISPIFYTNFNLLPPTYIETAEFDCLKDEALEYASKLKDVTLFKTKDTPHGFDIIKNSDAYNKALQARIEFMNKNFNK